MWVAAATAGEKNLAMLNLAASCRKRLECFVQQAMGVTCSIV
jgi:hypothetical protein